MLIISNTADPFVLSSFLPSSMPLPLTAALHSITPLASGRELNSLMGSSSRLLIQNSPGHCSLGSVSHCTVGHYRRYLLDGELPEDEKVCEVDRGYFPGSEKKDVSAMNEEEMELSRVGAEMANAWLEVSR